MKGTLPAGRSDCLGVSSRSDISPPTLRQTTRAERENLAHALPDGALTPPHRLLGVFRYRSHEGAAMLPSC